MAIPTVTQLGIAAKILYGKVILDRIKDEKLKLKGKLRVRFDQFRAAEKLLVSRQKAVDDANRRFDALAKALAKADDAQDAGVDDLAGEITHTKYGKRAKPFQALSKYATEALKKLAFVVEARELISIDRRIQADETAKAAVKRSSSSLAKLAKAVLAAAAAEERGQKDVTKTLTARAPAESAWTVAETRFRARASVEWEDKPGVYEGIFDEPTEAERATAAGSAAKKRARAKKKAAKGPTVEAKPTELRVKNPSKRSTKTTTTTTEVSETAAAADGSGAGAGEDPTKGS